MASVCVSESASGDGFSFVGIMIRIDFFIGQGQGFFAAEMRDDFFLNAMIDQLLRGHAKPDRRGAEIAAEVFASGVAAAFSGEMLIQQFHFVSAVDFFHHFLIHESLQG